MWSLCLVAALATPDSPFQGAKWLTVPNSSKPVERANWIWVQTPGGPKPTVDGAPHGEIRFTRDWTLAAKPSSAGVSFTADNSAVVSINGHQVGKADVWNRLFEYDVAGLLKEGLNRIEVLATNGPGSNIVNPAGFLFAARARVDGNEVSLYSDTRWSSPDGKVLVVGKYGTAPWNLGKTDVPVPVFHRSVKLAGKVVKATARVIGLGHYDLFANGKRQGDGLLNQPWSQYDRTLYWQEFDLTKSLQPGQNDIRVEMGNSWYRVVQPPTGRYTKGDAMPDFSGDSPFLLAAAIDVEYANGRSERIVTDKNWTWTTGPYTLSHIFAGEDYDASLKPGPSQPVLVTTAPKAKLRKMFWPAFRAVQSWKPSEIKSPHPGEWSYVFPQNAMAILKFRVKGKRGQIVKFRPSEVMNEKGEVQQLNLWSGDASAHYTLKGGARESHEWRFWYHGFQFVQVTGAVPAGKPNPKGLPVLESLEMVHVRSDNPQIGKFQTSNPLYNRIHDLVDWAMRSNMSYVMSDCPHREKLGWQECNHLLFRSFAYRYDCQSWFHKIAQDLRDAQEPDGRFPTVAPDYLMLPIDNPYKFTVEWGASGVLMPWQAYEWYGDRRFLEENFASMKRYVDWLIKDAKKGIARKGLGDWYDYGHGQGPGPSRYTPTDLTSTTIYAMCVKALSDTCRVLGKNSEAAHYLEVHSQIRKAFLREFYDPSTKTLENTGSVQSGNAMALCADLIPDQDRDEVSNAIVRELEQRGYQQTAGDVGHLFFIRALAEGGRSDVLHRVYNRTGIGSYGGVLAKGLTTMPETWDAITVGSNSLNHAMLGHVMEWFYGWVLGIRQATGSVGWKRFLIAPEVGELEWARGETAIPQGVVRVSWRHGMPDGLNKSQNGLSPRSIIIDLEIPGGSQGFVPAFGREASLDGKTYKFRQDQPMMVVGPGKHRVILK